MNITQQQIFDANGEKQSDHECEFDFIASRITSKGVDVNALLDRLVQFQVAIPSWALGTGGTRFGRFPSGGEPSTLEQKIDDIGILNALTSTAGAVSLHIPWDIPQDSQAIKERAASHGIIFDAVNSNTFQNPEGSSLSYKFGSLSHISKASREQAIEHNIDVINIGNKLDSKSMTVWLADGSCFPGQVNFQKALKNTQESLQTIYGHLPDDWQMFIEYKPYEPNFYSTVIQDWGTSLMLAEGCGEKAFTLVDLGHHLPNTNIEQIVATLMHKGKLGGFHFNDSKYGDDDLTVASIKPYAFFLIFNELVYGMKNNPNNPPLAWMIDASHNVKDPLEDLLQSLDAILITYTQALLIDHSALEAAQKNCDVTLAQEILQSAYRTDVRPLVAEARRRSGAALNPIQAFRSLKVRDTLVAERGSHTIATGL